MIRLSFLSGKPESRIDIRDSESIYEPMPEEEEPKTLEAAEAAKHAGEQAAKAEARKKATYLKAGIGVGIGSAAIAAALLYANASKKKKTD